MQTAVPDVPEVIQANVENQNPNPPENASKAAITGLFREVSDCTKMYFKSPVKAIGLSMFGVIRNMRNAFIDAARRIVSSQYDRGFWNVEDLISLAIISFLCWGAFIVAFFMAAYCIITYIMEKSLACNASIKSVYIGCSVNSIVPICMLFAGFVASFFSVPVALFLMSATISIFPVLGMVTAQYYCENNKSGKFLVLYLIGIGAISVASFYFLPKLIWGAVGTIQLCSPYDSVKVSLKSLVDTLPAASSVLDEYSLKEMFDEIVEEIIYAYFY